MRLPNKVLALLGGDTQNQGSFQLELDDAESNLLTTMLEEADASFDAATQDLIGEVTIFNNSGQALWFEITGAKRPGTNPKQEIPTGMSFTFSYIKFSELTIGNDSGVDIGKSDPPLNTASIIYQALEATQ